MPEIKEIIEIAPIRFTEVQDDAIDFLIKNYPIKRAEALKRGQNKWAKQNFTPYDIGIDCNAYHYFAFTQWQARPEPDDILLEIFDEGNLHEPSIRHKIESAGFKVCNINEPFVIKWGDALPVRGKMDMLLEVNGSKIPSEAKSMSPHIFDSVDTWEDMLNHNSPHVRAYPWQLMLYQHAFGKAKWGTFVLKNKVTGVVKFVKQPYMPEMIEVLKNRVLLLTKAIRDDIGDLDQMRNFEEKRCSGCDFKFQCLGARAEGMVAIIGNAELEMLLYRREELKKMKQEYEKIDKKVKEQLKGTDNAIIGDFFIRGKNVDRAGFTVAPTTYWKSDIVYKGMVLSKTETDV